MRISTFGEEVGGLVGGDAETPAVGEHGGPRLERERHRVGRLGRALEEPHHSPPVGEALGEVGGSHPAGGAPVPLRGLQALAGGFEVMREERCSLVELAGVDLGDRVGDPVVGPRAPLGELGAVGNLLRQRMLERILGDRIEALRIDELGRDQLPERGSELLLRKLRDPRQDGLGEVLADHGGDLERGLFPLTEPIDARSEDRLHARRDLEPLDGPHEPMGSPGAAQNAGLEQ